MLSPRIQWLFDSLSTEAQRCVKRSGITSVIETNAWETCEEFIAALPQEELTGDVYRELTSLWAASQGACAASIRQATRDLGCGRQQLEKKDNKQTAMLCQNVASGKVLPCALVAQSTDKRRKLTTASMSEAQLHIRDMQDRERVIVEAAATELWKVFLEVGDDGAQWQEYSLLDSKSKDEFAAMFFDDMCMVAACTLQSALRTLRRWRCYCREKDISAWRPPCIHVALWLRSLRERGPTAPNGAYCSLKWLEKKIGLRFFASSARVHDQAAVPASHLETQATPLLLIHLIGLERLVSSRNSAVSALALAWVMLTYAVLRFAHLQRSTILRVLDNAISGRASLGKRRTQGRRRPFDWRAPRWGITGLDLGSAVHSFIARAFAGGLQAAFFLPDLLPKRCTLQTCTGFASRSMSIGRFARLSQHMFQQAPFSMSAADASAFTSYSARRVLLLRSCARWILMSCYWWGTGKGSAANRLT